MKKINLILSLFGLLLLFSSCEKVIEVDLNKTDPKVSFEIQLNNTDSINYGTVRYSLSYFDNSSKGGITGVNIKVKKDDGSEETAKDLGNGIYSFSNLKRECGHTYYMIAKTPDGQEFKAEDFMPCVSDIDSLTYKFEEANGFFEKGYYAYFYGKDPQNERNFYKFDLIKNDTMVTKDAQTWILGDDKFLKDDGNLNGLKAPFVFKKFDTVTCTLQGMSEKHFYFLNDLQVQLNSDGGLFSPPPANARTNIDNNGIGFFSTVGQRSRTIIIK